MEDVSVTRRTFGTIRYRDVGFWEIKGEPHLLIRLKRIFPRSNQLEYGSVSFKDTAETCQELLWVMDRWPLEVSDQDLRYLQRRSTEHRDGIVRLERLVDVNYKPRPVGLAKPARDYQLVGAEVWKERRALLLGDDVGIGKTVTSIAGFVDPALRPCVVVCQAGTMPKQWMDKIHEFAPKLLVHIIEKSTVYPIPKFMGQSPDVLILTYHKLSAWVEVLSKFAKSLVFDEVQELRRTESQKWTAARAFCEAVEYVIGLTATPIYNYGDEIHSVVSVMMPDALGSREEFLREWTVGDKQVRDPKALGTYLRENFIMLRRTRSEVGRELPPVERIVYEIDSDQKALEAVSGRAANLAKIILRQTEERMGGDAKTIGREIGEASRELDRLMRQATGIAKAPFVAEFVKMLIEAGERPVVYAWHREVYSILQEKLQDYGVAMFTGTESPQKKEREKTRFIDGEAKTLLVSLRSGAGLDGLQFASRTVVFAELDWSPGIHTQCIGRVDRDGQKDPVQAYYCVTNAGSDPTVAEVNGIKEEQSEGIRNPDADNIEELQVDPKRLRKLAEAVLAKKPKSGDHS